jgi:hypothetical protein
MSILAPGKKRGEELSYVAESACPNSADSLIYLRKQRGIFVVNWRMRGMRNIIIYLIGPSSMVSGLVHLVSTAQEMRADTTSSGYTSID